MTDKKRDSFFPVTIPITLTKRMADDLRSASKERKQPKTAIVRTALHKELYLTPSE